MEPSFPVRSPAVSAPYRLRHVPALLLCLGLAVLANSPGRRTWLASHGLSALTVAIVLGIAVGTLVPGSWLCVADPGVNFAKQVLLRTGIVLYGVRLTLQDIGRVGAAGVGIDALALSSSFAFDWLLGMQLLKMVRQITVLLDVGSFVCGAAAVLATQPMVHADSGN